VSLTFRCPGCVSGGVRARTMTQDKLTSLCVQGCSRLCGVCSVMCASGLPRGSEWTQTGGETVRSVPSAWLERSGPWGTVESQGGLGWKGPYRSSSSNPPAMGRDPFYQPRVLPVLSSLASNPAREGASTAPLGSLGQGFTTLIVKNFFLISHLNLPSFSLNLLPLSYHNRSC